MQFLVAQFEVCSFPDAQAFIEHLLQKGKALILFDGLDEVNQEENKRSRMITTLVNFSKRYPEIHISITCRIAATDYSFDQFTYLEIADFDERQVHQFVSKWYHDNQPMLSRFQREFEKPEHEGLRELARTPLLLALLCLTFDETLTFPPRRVDLYKEALDALLKKWDASRGIQRDKIYRDLSVGRKEQMLGRLAAQNFDAGSYFVREETLTGQIQHYLRQLPSINPDDVPDGEAVLKAIEAQHGILVERAHGIYSFSHLTFQEYFTARYIVDNAAEGTIYRLIERHITDDRWHEVFLLTVSLLDNADTFFEILLKRIATLIEKDEQCVALLYWINDKTASSKNQGVNNRILMFSSALTLALAMDVDRALTYTREVDHHRRSRAYIPAEEELPGRENLATENLTRSFVRTLDHAIDHAYATTVSRTITDVFALALDLQLNNEFLNSLEQMRRCSLNIVDAADSAHVRVLDLAIKRAFLTTSHVSELKGKLELKLRQIKLLSQYVNANLLLSKCLQLSVVSDREAIREQMLLLPQSIENKNTIS